MMAPLATTRLLGPQSVQKRGLILPRVFATDLAQERRHHDALDPLRNAPLEGEAAVKAVQLGQGVKHLGLEPRFKRRKRRSVQPGRHLPKGLPSLRVGKGRLRSWLGGLGHRFQQVGTLGATEGCSEWNLGQMCVQDLTQGRWCGRGRKFRTVARHVTWRAGEPTPAGNRRGGR